MEYVNEYVTPYFFKNLRFSDPSAINQNIIKDPLFENIVLGYAILLNQEIEVYKDNLSKIQSLKTQLARQDIAD